jgi:hypothetical protein
MAMKLGKKQGLEFVHETIIEGRKILQTIRTGLFQFLKKEDLGTRVQLFQKLAEFTHGIVPGGDTENIVNKPFHELLRNIFAGEIALGNFTGSQILVEWDGLCCKWEIRLRSYGHAEVTPRL